jgi:hypothetical protein
VTFAPGGALHIMSPSRNIRHTHVIMAASGGTVAHVSITSAHEGRRDMDDACILLGGEHPLVKHRSFAYYRKAALESEDDLRAGLQMKRVLPLPDCSSVLLRMVVEGAFLSPHIKPSVLKFVRDHCPI